MKEIGVVLWKLPPREIANIFAKFPPSKNDHVYSICEMKMAYHTSLCPL